MSITTDIANYTDKRGREINEDSLVIGDTFFAVADGLGGHDAGETASAATVEYLKNVCRGIYTDEIVLELMNGANRAVLDLHSQARSTVAAGFIYGDKFRMANVGDSRVYYFRDGKILTMTKDHSVCGAAVELGTLKFEEIRGSEDRSSLLKALGNDDNLNLKKTYPSIEIQNKDAFLICSDGFWDFVIENEMEEDLSSAANADDWLQKMLKRNIERSGGADDNCTAICGIFSVSEDTPADRKTEHIGFFSRLFGKNKTQKR